MNRSKRVVVLCHCILNSNSKVTPLASYPGVLFEAVEQFIKKGTGIIQLPCPESTFLGMNRWGMSKDQYDSEAYRDHCRSLLKPYINQIISFTKAGYEITGVVGINGSPSCGINKTPMGLKGGVTEGKNPFSDLEYVEESGVFIEEFKELLKKKGLNLKFMFIDENKPSNIEEA